LKIQLAAKGERNVHTDNSAGIPDRNRRSSLQGNGRHVETVGTSNGKETQMAVWTPFVLSFLFGMATPVVFVRVLLRRQGDSGACLMEFILLALAVMIVLTLWFGFR